MELFLFILIAIGITMVYDARKITKNYFSKQDQNKTVIIIKLVGFLVCIFSGFAICIFNNT